MTNHRLRGAMLNAELTAVGLAESVGVDVKTVGRWLAEECVPYPVTRVKVARVLDQQETFLWPSLLRRPDSCEIATLQIDGVWPVRTAISSDTWHGFFNRTTDRIDILVYAGDFLIETLDLFDVLRYKASRGAAIRLLVGEPHSDSVQARARELADESIPGRCGLMLRYLKPLAQAEALMVRAHAATVYASHFRFDDTLLVNQHAFGAWESQSPVFHLQPSGDSSLLHFFADAFERTWATARQIVV